MNILSLNDNNIYNNILWGPTKAPSYCYIEITRKCNCNCAYCQIGNSLSNNDMELSLFKNIIDQLHSLGVFEIRLGGGEPLLSKKLIEMIEYINKKNMSVWICTNGILLTTDLCKQLKKLKVIGVRVSLDSLKKGVNDNIRGHKGYFNKSTLGMKKAYEAGLKVLIGMTIGNHNIDEIGNMKLFAKEKNYQLYTHFIMPIGKGKDYLDNNSVKKEKIIKILDDIDGEKNCVAGTQSISIDVNGNVSPCTFIKPVDSLKNNTLENILKSNDFCKYLKQVPNNNCNTCQFNKTIINNKCVISTICRGGCWAIYEKDK